MRQFILIALLFLMSTHGFSQELYVFSEPASNMPSKSVGLKFTARYPHRADGINKQRYMPEIMFGINKNWMVHISSTLSDYYQKKIKLESGKAYVKYRFFSNDDVHKHLRIAAFADAGFTRNPYTYMDANLEGDNDGVQLGVIATQLVNKLAVSGTVSYLKILGDNNGELHHQTRAYNMLNYSLSTGYLLLPKEYVNYNQTNVNLYLEALGMQGLDKNHYSLDLAPALQFIFNSNSKINLGYRFQVAGNMNRTGKQMLQISLERTILNAWK